jgi:hypothetical protein
MKCQLIQTSKIADKNLGEREMLGFLQNLPADYFVYRELQVTPEYRDRVRGIEQKKPDFVVVAPEIGLLSIEVKDWNLTRNAYEWRDQYTIEVTDRATGRVREIDNPTDQAKAYLYALMELVSGLDTFVTSIVAFPRVSRSDFLNRLENVGLLQNPQTRFYLDLNRTLFREDLDRCVARPEELLRTVVEKDAKFRSSSSAEVREVNRRLLPSSFRIGDYTERQRNQHRLKMISKQQQRWIFGLDPRQNYLLDVAGSGKTNVLISKAIHTVESAGDGALPRILLTTYSSNLETNIRRIFQHKIADSPDLARYQRAITIRCVPALMESIITDVLEIDDIGKYRGADECPEAYEKQLREDVEEILRAEPNRFRRFDHVFVDEIQDFDNFYLLVIDHLCKAKSFFFVGDVGQKIYRRRHDLERLGFVTDRAEVERSYKMFRTPRYIAELATRFVLGDPRARSEFADHGYTESFTYPNKLKNVSEVLRSSRPAQETGQRVRAFLDTTYSEEDILVVTSAQRLKNVEDALSAQDVPYVLGEPEHGAAVSLVDFVGVKGLEKEVVLVSGIEDLYDRSKPQRTFEDEDERYQEELLSRRKVYVALTRTLEQLIIYYQDPSSRFVSELLQINNDILDRW